MSDIIKRDAEKTGLELLGSSEEMQQKLNASIARIKMVHDFVETNFVRGEDYGIADDRVKKDCLLKAGAEKVAILFTRPRWRRDEETWDMLGRPAGVVCYVCEIIDNATGEVIGEGRGAETVGNKKRDANKTIKIAKKCALVDAVLTTFGLSGKFTQDTQEGMDELRNAKLRLLSAVEDERAGVDSQLSDRQFIVRASENYIHQKTLNTLGAVTKMYKAIIVDRLFDWSTGEVAK